MHHLQPRLLLQCRLDHPYAELVHGRHVLLGRPSVSVSGGHLYGPHQTDRVYLFLRRWLLLSGGLHLEHAGHLHDWQLLPRPQRYTRCVHARFFLRHARPVGADRTVRGRILLPVGFVVGAASSVLGVVLLSGRRAGAHSLFGRFLLRHGRSLGAHRRVQRRHVLRGRRVGRDANQRVYVCAAHRAVCADRVSGRLVLRDRGPLGGDGHVPDRLLLPGPSQRARHCARRQPRAHYGPVGGHAVPGRAHLHDGGLDGAVQLPGRLVLPGRRRVGARRVRDRTILSGALVAAHELHGRRVLRRVWAERRQRRMRARLVLSGRRVERNANRVPAVFVLPGGVGRPAAVRCGLGAYCLVLRHVSRGSVPVVVPQHGTRCSSERLLQSGPVLHDRVPLECDRVPGWHFLPGRIKGAHRVHGRSRVRHCEHVGGRRAVSDRFVLPHGFERAHSVHARSFLRDRRPRGRHRVMQRRLLLSVGLVRRHASAVRGRHVLRRGR
jgi:hypothetical protein